MANPVTGSLNCAVIATTAAFVGPVAGLPVRVIVGAALSQVMENGVGVEAVLGLPARSVALFAAMLTVTAPLAVGVTSKV